MNGEYWEPHQFAVGERVRVRISPECPHRHHPSEHGAIGTVMTVPFFVRPSQDGHTVGVLFNPELQCDGWRVWGASFAAVELEPLAATPADAPSRGRGAE